LVVEDKDGNRLKNLVFDHPVQAGDNVIYWDGSSMTGIAAPGTYVVRGIFHEGITPHLEYSIYSPGRPPWPTADGTGAWLADHTAPASALFLPEGSPWLAKDTKPLVLLGADSAEAGNALENGVCRPIASSGRVGSGPHHWPTLDEPDIKKKMPIGPANSIFFVWTDRNHDHAVQPNEVEFTRPSTAGSEGVVFQPDLSVISGGPYHLPATNVDEMGVPSYNLNRLQLVSSIAAKGDVAMSPDGWFVAGFTGFKDGQPRWTLVTRDIKTPPAGYGELENPERMLGYPVQSTHGEAGYFVARYSYMGEIYVYSVDGILITTLGGDTRSAPFWPYPEQKPGMAIKGLSFDAEQFWPFMFGLDDGNVYLSVGKWHSSIVRLDGLDRVRRIDLDAVNATAEMIAAAAPARVEEASKNAMCDEISVRPIQAKIDGDLSEWPAKGWATINPKCSFQLERVLNFAPS